MNPNDFVDLSTVDNTYRVATGVGAIVLLALAVLFLEIAVLNLVRWKKNGDKIYGKVVAGFGSLMLATGVVGVVLAVESTSARDAIQQEREEKVRAFLTDRYDITVTDDQLEDLVLYHSASGVEYDSTNADVEDDELTIYLIESSERDDFYSISTIIPLGAL